MTEDSSSFTVSCSICHSAFKRSKKREEKKPLVFCAYCGNRLRPLFLKKNSTKLQHFFDSISLPHESKPKKEELLATIGQYEIIKSLGKGGMGEVFLAYDTVCGRKVALKQVRGDLAVHPQLYKRFLKEARITSQLTHPTIMPIYSIHYDANTVYYTMPYVEGKTLKQILRKTREDEKKGIKSSDPHTSIAFLTRIFLQICQACAYAHHQGILHRDLKPENFIVGTYGQVIILDWGLAKIFEEESCEEESLQIDPEKAPKEKGITKLGKVVGTVSYMAPERAFGAPATIQTDIYALGVILYQILTLQLPFPRKSISQFKKNYKKETFHPPELVAPYREVPAILSSIAKKCLHKNPKERYHSLNELIHSLENYISGESEWFLARTLDIHKNEDWAFQENILFVEHSAITKALDVSDWVSLMVSKDAFPNHTKIEAEVLIKKKGHGIGFLFSHSEFSDPGHLTDGYCLWVVSSAEKTRKTKLLRSSIPVLEAPDVTLQNGEWYTIRIEKNDQHMHFYLNDELCFSYVNHIPIIGPHIGILTKDADFEVKNFSVSVSSQNITVQCLAVPDAFLASHDYDHALSEYRRIGASFPGRSEGREALFRAGITLLEKAKKYGKEELFSQVNKEFEKLRNTSGAPLEYLGKGLMYQTLKDCDEELKCYELALRRYKRHPLLPILGEHIHFRMQESARKNRRTAYGFINLMFRFLPDLTTTFASKKLLQHLQKNWEKLPFTLFAPKEYDSDVRQKSLSISLAFWLGKPFLIKEAMLELLEKPILPMPLISDAFFHMLELEALQQATDCLKMIDERLSPNEKKRFAEFLEPIEQALSFQSITPNKNLLLFLFRYNLNHEKYDAIESLLPHTEELDCPFIDALKTEFFLYTHAYDKAEKLLSKYPKKELTSDSSPLYFIYFAFVTGTQGKAKGLKQISQLLKTSYPPSYTLGAHFLLDNIDVERGSWFRHSFPYERIKLFEQLTLYYHLLKDEERKQGFQMMRNTEYTKLNY